MKATLAGKDDYGVPLVADVKVGADWNNMIELQ
jgi:hypothetical protein